MALDRLTLPLLTTEPEVELIRRRLLAMAAGYPDPGERWDEVLRRCRQFPLRLGEAAWWVVEELAEGHPRSWRRA